MKRVIYFSLYLTIYPLHALAYTFHPVGSPLTLDAGFRCAVPYWGVADFNGDGQKDVALGLTPYTAFTEFSDPAQPFILTINSSGEITDSTNTIFNGPPSKTLMFVDVLVDDFNKDGRPDLFLPNSTLDIPQTPPIKGGLFSLALSNGNQLFDTTNRYTNFPQAIGTQPAVADIDNDGDLDIYVSSINSQSYFLINDGKGHFNYTRSILPELALTGEGGSWLPNGDFLGSTSQYTASLLSDIDNDGYKDLLFFGSHSVTNSYAILNNNRSFIGTKHIKLPQGLYGAGKEIQHKNPDGTVAILQGPGTVSVWAKEINLNNDGFMDLVIAQTNIDNEKDISWRGGRLQLLVNNAGKGFIDETALRGAPGFDPANNGDAYNGTPSIVDFNQDGYDDIIALRVVGANYQTHFFINDGKGRFNLEMPDGIPIDGFVAPLSITEESTRSLLHLNIYWNQGTVEGCQLKAQVYSDSPFKLTVDKSGAGTVISQPTGIDCGDTCKASFDSGSTVKLIAQPDNGSQFNGWEGACSGYAACTVLIDGDKSLTAKFIELPEYPLTVLKQSGGLVSSEPQGILCGGINKQCNGRFSTVQLTASPDVGFEFLKWVGCQNSQANICLVQLKGKTKVKAVFKPLPKYPLKVTKNGLGSITSNPSGLNCPGKKRSCSTKFTVATQVTLTPTPQTGSSFIEWTGDCSGNQLCSISMDKAKNVGALFR